MTDQELSRRLTGDVAIVTGAGGGIGGAVARRLAAEGAAVAVNDIDAARAQVVADDITAAGGRAIAVRADMSDPEQVQAVVDTTVAELGTVSILINNAGLIGQTRHFLKADDEWWHRLIGNNLSSVFYCTSRVAPIMAKAGRGVIISSSSGGATRAHRGEAAYDAAKGGIEALTRAAALDLAPYGIRVCAVAPGSIDVAPAGAVSDEVLAARGAGIPLGRVGRPEDLAAAYAFLASHEASYITGVALSVDGGMIIQQRSPQVDIFGLDQFPVLDA